MGSCLSFQKVRLYTITSLLDLQFLSILNIPPTCFVMFYMSNDDGDIETKWIRYKRYGSKYSLLFAPMVWPMRPLAVVYKTLQIKRAIQK